MPEWLNAATGLDALTHGIEAYVSKAANTLTDVHALKAIELIAGNLTHTIRHPAEMPARTGMAQASLEAGLAFTNAILGATHAMSHPGRRRAGPAARGHQRRAAATVIRFNAQADPQRFLPIARALGMTEGAAAPTEAGEWTAERVRALADEVGVPKGLAGLGVTPEDSPALARTTMGDACLSTNPRTAELADIDALFRAAL